MAAIEGVQAIEYTRDMGSITTSATTQPGIIDIPEITVKDPARIGTAKWKIIDRETQNRGTWIKQDLVLEWQEAKEPKEPGLGEEPLKYVSHISGQIGTAYLIKCQLAVYRGLEIRDDLEQLQWGEDMDLQEQRWNRWMRDAQPMQRGPAICLAAHKFGLRRNEILFIRMTMRSWAMTSLTGGWSGGGDYGSDNSGHKHTSTGTKKLIYYTYE
jgi:hypothetical protein